jgi:multiple sugar transport system permease protein
MSADATKSESSATTRALRGPLAFAVTALLGIAAVVWSAPLLWMALTSTKPAEQAASASLAPLPTPASKTLSFIAENYSAVWNDESVMFPVYLRNTLIVALLSVVGMTLSSAIVAYGFARIDFKGKGFFFALTLATMMVPFPILMGPLFVMFGELGWIGTLKPLWLPAWFGGAFNIFLLRQFFMGIPKELDEAARIDGCGHVGIFCRVILPLSRPALAVVALFHFIYVWNDFLAPLIFLTHRDDFTLALGLQMYQSKAGNTPWNLLMAAGTMVVLPVAILFMLTQRQFVRGLSSGGGKE